MIGTITNAGAILIGCAVGGTLKKGIGERYKTVMMDAMGCLLYTSDAADE